jgi:exopolysaccharide biosynthesis protein
MAMIMKSLGCYDAMNLDGGGSSVMVIDGKNVMSTLRPDASRRISVGLGVRLLP